MGRWSRRTPIATRDAARGPSTTGRFAKRSSHSAQDDRLGVASSVLPQCRNETLLQSVSNLFWRNDAQKLAVTHIDRCLSTFPAHTRSGPAHLRWQKLVG